MADDTLPDESLEQSHPGCMKPRRALEDTEMDITPMIDITFLLLIFFIVASKMDQSGAVPLPPAKTGGTVLLKQSVIITVGAGDTSETAKVYKGDGESSETLIDAADIAALESELQAYVEEEVGKDQKKTTVLIKGAKGVKHKHISTTAKAAARIAEVQHMAWAVMEVN